MEKFPPKFSKLLVTPEPHYIPGYSGYCPQLKYHLGRTYSQLTAKLLTSPKITHSQRLVLSSGTGTENEIQKTETATGGQLKRVIPGYTGFVPRLQNCFSKTYAETCREALSEFDSDQKRTQLASADPLPAVRNTLRDNKTQRLNTPLTAVCKEPAPYKAVDSWKPLGSPYQMKDNNPHKYFISGFTGYVPKARFLIGKGYPITTNRALILFGNEMKEVHTDSSLTRESTDELPQVPTIYHPNQGLLPYYTGHVPGYKFQYGQTFGHLTSNSLALSSTHREFKSQE